MKNILFVLYVVAVCLIVSCSTGIKLEEYEYISNDSSIHIGFPHGSRYSCHFFYIIYNHDDYRQTFWTNDASTDTIIIEDEVNYYHKCLFLVGKDKITLIPCDRDSFLFRNEKLKKVVFLKKKR